MNAVDINLRHTTLPSNTKPHFWPSHWPAFMYAASAVDFACSSGSVCMLARARNRATELNCMLQAFEHPQASPRADRHDAGSNAFWALLICARATRYTLPVRTCFISTVPVPPVGFASHAFSLSSGPSDSSSASSKPSASGARPWSVTSCSW